MADGERSTTESGSARRDNTPAAEIIDFGVASLDVPVHVAAAVEVTEFLETQPGAKAATHFPDAEEIADYIDDAGMVAPSRPGGFVRRTVVAVFRFIAWSVRSLFGIASLILLLALIAAIPIVNFLALGYLLEVEGRMARSGKLRDAFPLLNQAPRLGSIALGIWAWVIPLRLLSNLAADARLIDPGSFADVSLHIVLPVLAVLVAVHLCLALAHGGSLWAFMWPLMLPIAVVLGGVLLLVTARFVIAGLLLAALIAFIVHRGNTLEWFIGVLRGWRLALFGQAKNYLAYLRRLPTTAYWNQAGAAVRDFIAGLRLKHHFLLGLKGYIGAMIWLVIPTAIFASARKTEGGPILTTLFGGMLLMLVLSWVPFLQAHYSAENRFRAMFELGKVRQFYERAPFSWTITMLVTLTLALPMYLFKVALPPRDAMWLVTVVFIISIYPVKVITGWAYHRAVHRERRISFGLHWLTRIVLLPFLATYVFLLFFTQFIGEHGKLVLFEHHAFLLPAPF